MKCKLNYTLTKTFLSLKVKKEFVKYTLVNMQAKYKFFCTEQAFVRTYCKNINVLHRGMFYLLTPNTIKGERL